jgi:hypothetical protein
MADNTYTVKITTQAEEQLQEIVKYIRFRIKSTKSRPASAQQNGTLDFVTFTVSAAGCFDRGRTVVQLWHSQNACEKLFHLFLD